VSTDSARERAVAAHRTLWGEPDLVVRAPGRVNLIGEHTDYNAGFVLPMALPFDTVVATSPAPDGRTVLRSEGFGEVEISADGPGRDCPSWAAHIQGMVEVMGADDVSAPPWRATVATDIPTGASLSSSAAIEVAVGATIAARSGNAVDPVRIAEYGQQVETRLLGAPTGIMDQLISATAVAGAASLIDCRSLESTPATLPTGTVVVVMDTMTRRELVDSEFSARMTACHRAAELLGVDALRDVDDVSSLRESHDLEWRRASHVVAENARTIAAAEAMAADDALTLGALMNESHASLRDLFEVSSEALDTIVSAAAAAPGCLGARMTGGGFAGCAVALVSAGSVDEFVAAVEVAYERQTGTSPRSWACAAAAGASFEWLSEDE
jgi:galactokinase